MQSNIYLDPEKLNLIIDKLKKERENLEKVFNNIKTDASGMLNYWAGTTGEEVSTELNNDTLIFEKIIKDMDQYILFLENMVRAYYQMDNSINKKMEENASVNAY